MAHFLSCVSSTAQAADEFGYDRGGYAIPNLNQVRKGDIQWVEVTSDYVRRTFDRKFVRLVETKTEEWHSTNYVPPENLEVSSLKYVLEEDVEGETHNETWFGYNEFGTEECALGTMRLCLRLRSRAA